MTVAGAVDYMQRQLWEKLEVAFTKYSKIPTSQVEELIYDLLNEQTPQEIDYVVKNMFRLDVDNSGTVSFEEFGNFLFKRHCGEMSLQKMHMQNKISHGKERKITSQEFHELILNAYKFLGVTVHPEITGYIFNQTDTDHDGLITYVEYFEIINKYVCHPSEANKTGTLLFLNSAIKPIQITGKERNSRLRSYMWIQLRKLYESYIHGRNLPVNEVELRGLIVSIVGDLSETEMTFLLTNLYKTNIKFIIFEPFAESFLYLIAELKLTTFSRFNSSVIKTLSRDEFNILFKNTYHFLTLGRMKLSYLELLYKIIDQNHDGVVSYEEYLDWIRRFISVTKYYGDEFYFVEDDLDIDPSDNFLFEPDKKPVEINKSTQEKNKFIFSDYSLAYIVRERMLSLLVEFDANNDHLFDKEEIENALKKLLKENENELKYVTQNVFRYDRDGDRNVTYDELTNFCVEQHFGEMAIQRLHRKRQYSRGKDRVMNFEEFTQTLSYCLSFIQVEATSQQLKTLFSEIDLDHDGWITYEVYFFFLKYYFGSLSAASKQPKFTIEHKQGTLEKDKELLSRVVNLEAIEKFVKLLMEQLRETCLRYDLNKNMLYEQEEIEAILAEVFHLYREEIDYILYSYFRFGLRTQKSVTYEELIALILEIYFVEILFKRKYAGKEESFWKERKISIREFIDFMYESCFFVKVRPTESDLLSIFEILDTDKDGFITFEQYIKFIRHYLGRGLQVIDNSKEEEKLSTQVSVEGISKEEYDFVNLIWSELKIYFDRYDEGKKGYLIESELKSFAIDILHESSQRELDYIFWNLFRVDSNFNKQVDFNEFVIYFLTIKAPFILKHAAEISLQRFHQQQIKGNSTLNESQFYSVINSAYNFLVSIPKSKSVLNLIHQRIQTNGTLTYSKFLAWVHYAIASRFK